MPKKRASAPTEPVVSAELSAPRDLQALTFRVGEDEFVVLSFPLGPTELPPDLTPVERGVVEAVLQGKTNADIARERGRSPRTIANQVATVFKKLGVRSRRELAAQCARGPR